MCWTAFRKLPPLVDGIALPDFPGVLDDVMLAE
jgi:hypothetical protein